jgi:Zn-dependent peptidase ImmA (M78 family)
MMDIACVIRPMMTDGVSGAFVRAGSARVFLINSEKSLGHQCFTIGHELYHAVHDTELREQSCRIEIGKGTERERLANAFSANFLAPHEGIVHFLDARLAGKRPIALHDVLYLENLFQISHAAMVLRLHRFGLITPAQRNESQSIKVIAAARRWGYDEDLYLPTRRSKIVSRYREKAEWALEQDMISFVKYEEMLTEAGLLDGPVSKVEEDTDDVGD